MKIYRIEGDTPEEDIFVTFETDADARTVLSAIHHPELEPIEIIHSPEVTCEVGYDLRENRINTRYYIEFLGCNESYTIVKDDYITACVTTRISEGRGITVATKMARDMVTQLLGEHFMRKANVQE